MPDAYPHQGLSDVVHGRRGWYMPGAELPATPLAICAGSFNPLHPAHVQLLKIGQAKTNLPGIFELSITNVDKPPLEYAEIRKRIAQFELRQLAVVVTNRPRYLGKIEIFPRGSFFVMGSDTFERVVNTYYYQAGETPLEIFEAAGARFVVAARRNKLGAVLTAENVLQSTPTPERWASLTLCISPDEFLIDMSSTAIRNELVR
jgi:nicotinic acid mononucleotide adenylyltransferase